MHPLVQQVDDQAVAARRQLADEGLAEHDGRAQVGLEVAVPGSPGRRSSRRSSSNVEALLTSTPSGPSARAASGTTRAASASRREIAADHDRAPPQRLDRAGERLGLLARAVTVDRHVAAGAGDGQRHRGPEPLGRAGDQRRAGRLIHGGPSSCFSRHTGGAGAPDRVPRR